MAVFSVAGLQLQPGNGLLQLSDTLFHIKDAGFHVVALISFGLCILVSFLLQLLGKRGQILYLLHPTGCQIAGLFGSEVFQRVVGGKVVNNQFKIFDNYIDFFREKLPEGAFALW
mgnify:CR=1 FL=1